MLKTDVSLLWLKNQPSCNQPKYQYKDGYAIMNDSGASTVASSRDDASDATSETVTSPQFEKPCYISGQNAAASSTCTQKPYSASSCGGYKPPSARGCR
jgi:hypothetical protein